MAAKTEAEEDVLTYITHSNDLDGDYFMRRVLDLRNERGTI